MIDLIFPLELFAAFIGLLYGLELQGYAVGAPLPPQTPLSDAGRAEVKAILADLGALEGVRAVR